MEVFFSGKNVEKLSNILAEDLTFEGPFHKFESADDYINSLRLDPPIGCEYRLIKSFEDESNACLVYQFFKPSICVLMAQVFETSNGKITRILLIFDTGCFA